MSKSWHISRRTVLRGLGTALSLPLLESMMPPVAWGASKPAEVPLRLAFLYVPNGMNMSEWRPTKEGRDFDLKSILEPLAKVKNEINVLTGLSQQKAAANGDGAGDHARAGATFLTGVQVKKTAGTDIRAATSVDQVAAQQIGLKTRFPSLEIGCEEGPLAGGCDSGYSCAYSHSIAWRTENTPVAKEINPRLLFERLFSSGRPQESAAAKAKREKYQNSILDFVNADAKSLHQSLGATDKRKLDEYLSAVRELEQRMARVDQIPVLTGKGFEKPSGVPKDYAEHLRLMGDLLVLAFQTDSTRVATFMLANEGSNRRYPTIQVNDGHHELSHHNRVPEKLEKIRKINLFHTQALAYFLEKLQATPEGDSNLLQHSMIVYGSGISDGDRHNHDDLPILLCGTGGGSITTGRHVVYKNGTPLMNLYLSLLERVGSRVEHLGDSTGKLDQLKI
jgi:Protein of unknown function (DUF1552)